MNEAVATLLIVFLSFLVGATVFMIPLRRILFAWLGAKLGKDKILVCLVDTARSRGLWKTARLKTPGVYEYVRGVGEDKKPLTHVLTVSNGCMVRFLGVDVAYVIPGDTASLNFQKVVRIKNDDEKGDSFAYFEGYNDSSLISNYGKRSATVPKLNSGLNFDLKTLLIIIVVAVGGFILFKLLMGGGLGGEEAAANVVSNTTTVIS